VTVSRRKRRAKLVGVGAGALLLGAAGTWALERFLAGHRTGSWQGAIQTATAVALIAVTGSYVLLTQRLVATQANAINASARLAALNRVNELVSNPPMPVFGLPVYVRNWLTFPPATFPDDKSWEEVTEVVAFRGRVLEVTPLMVPALRSPAASVVDQFTACCVARTRLRSAVTEEKMSATSEGRGLETIAWSDVQTRYETPDTETEGPVRVSWDDLANGVDGQAALDALGILRVAAIEALRSAVPDE
jgi:hypothetical protein